MLNTLKSYTRYTYSFLAADIEKMTVAYKSAIRMTTLKDPHLNMHVF